MSESTRARAIGNLKRECYLASLLTHKYPREAAERIASLEEEISALESRRDSDIRALQGAR